ncbi:hypothetical protein [Arthrobacter sp. D1-17]
MLLSQFGDWHSALNRSPLIIELPGESDEEYMARLERAFEDVDARVRAAGVTPDAGYRHWPEDLRSELESSWEFILDPGNYGALRQLAAHPRTACTRTTSCRRSGCNAEAVPGPGIGSVECRGRP